MQEIKWYSSVRVEKISSARIEVIKCSTCGKTILICDYIDMCYELIGCINAGHNYRTVEIHEDVSVELWHLPDGGVSIGWTK